MRQACLLVLQQLAVRRSSLGWGMALWQAANSRSASLPCRMYSFCVCVRLLLLGSACNFVVTVQASVCFLNIDVDELCHSSFAWCLCAPSHFVCWY